MYILVMMLGNGGSIPKHTYSCYKYRACGTFVHFTLSSLYTGGGFCAMFLIFGCEFHWNAFILIPNTSRTARIVNVVRLLLLMLLLKMWFFGTQIIRYYFLFHFFLLSVVVALNLLTKYQLSGGPHTKKKIAFRRISFGQNATVLGFRWQQNTQTPTNIPLTTWIRLLGCKWHDERETERQSEKEKRRMKRKFSKLYTHTNTIVGVEWIP